MDSSPARNVEAARAREGERSEFPKKEIVLFGAAEMPLFIVAAGDEPAATRVRVTGDC